MPRFFTAPLAIATILIAACAAGPADTPHPLAGQAIATPPPPARGAVDLPRFPSISPDGSTICFSWRGDLWRVGINGGQAQRLTAHPGLDDLSTWSPDGKQIAFNSERSGFRNVYRMNADGSDVQPVTREDRYLYISDWPNADRLAVTGYIEGDIHKNPRPYSVATNGGPITRLHDAFGRSPVVSPDGKHIAFVRGRSSWDRPFSTNPDTRELWLYSNVDKTFRQLTTNPGHDGKPRWLNNNTLVYLSAKPHDRINLYQLKIEDGEQKATALTAFTEDDVQHFDISRDGKTAVLHVWDKLYTLDLNKPKAKPVALTITAPTDVGDLTLVQQLANKANDAALSPDGKVMAVGVRGELFVRQVDSKNPPQRITNNIALDSDPVWSPDGRWLYFVSDRSGTLGIYRAKVALTRSEIEQALKPVETEDESPDENEPNEEGEQEEVEDVDTPKRWHDAVRFSIEPVIDSLNHESSPSPSPDGKTLAYKRGNGDIVLLDLASDEQRDFHNGWSTSTHWAWSADSKYLAICYEDQDHNTDIWLGPADASTPPINLTKHPGSDYLPSFSLDGRILSFISNRTDDQFDVYAVYLDKSLETYTPQQLSEYYEKSAAAAKKRKPLTTEQPRETPEKESGETKKDEAQTDEEPESKKEEDQKKADPPFEITPADLADAYRRLRQITKTSESEWDAELHPSGASVVYSREDTVFTIGWDGKDEKKVADKLDPKHLSLSGSSVVGLRGGTAAVVELGGKSTEVKMQGSIRVDRRAHQRQRFTECARAITQNFYDGTFKGIDWHGATKKYEQLASRAWTANEFDDVVEKYMGLLNASHMGVRSPEPDATNSEPNGRLGAMYERVEKGYKVVAIEPQTPAAMGPMRLEIGDIITAIGFEPIDPADTVTSKLAGRVGQETAISVLRLIEGDDDPIELHLLLTPISYRAYDAIRYENWQRSQLALVDKWSDGRLGYIHIESMNESSLAEFERDLYAACEGRDGLIIDVRDNGGGWTTDRLLGSIMTRRHAYTVPRGADPTRTNSYPNSRLFITRYNLPINALCNENSFSNAEIFSHAFKTLERGTLVGNTTAGGVISTGGTRLLDGTSIRLPFRGWYLPDGTDMENNGAVPHLLVPQTPENESKGYDAQLKAAVQDLVKRLDK